MDKTFLKKGMGYYIRAEGYSLNAWEEGFLNIGVLYHTAEGEHQTAMSYKYETQKIAIKDKPQSEIQDITFGDLDDDTKFTLA
jgi:hypothetical protein